MARSGTAVGRRAFDRLRVCYAAHPSERLPHAAPEAAAIQEAVELSLEARSCAVEVSPAHRETHTIGTSSV
jgi:hypothetical protein